MILQPTAIFDAAVTERVPDRERDFSPFLEHVMASPRDEGTLEAIVRRPGQDRREVLAEGELDVTAGLVGDDWLARGSGSTPDGSAHPDAQLTLMSVRVLEAMEPDPSRWPLAGDQLLVDLDLSVDNLPVRTRLAVGGAELVVADKVHAGCAKFSGRFGSDALRWTVTDEGKRLRFRGVYVRVVTGGTIRVGDAIRRL